MILCYCLSVINVDQYQKKRLDQGIAMGFHILQGYPPPFEKPCIIWDWFGKLGWGIFSPPYMTRMLVTPYISVWQAISLEMISSKAEFFYLWEFWTDFSSISVGLVISFERTEE